MRIWGFLEVSCSKKPWENMLWGLLGAIFEYLGDLLSSYRILEPFWGHVGTCFWGFLELSWSISAIFSRLTASWSHFGAILEPSWGAKHLGKTRVFGILEVSCRYLPDLEAACDNFA